MGAALVETVHIHQDARQSLRIGLPEEGGTKDATQILTVGAKPLLG